MQTDSSDLDPYVTHCFVDPRESSPEWQLNQFTVFALFIHPRAQSAILSPLSAEK